MSKLKPDFVIDGKYAYIVATKVMKKGEKPLPVVEIQGKLKRYVYDPKTGKIVQELGIV